VGNVLAAVFLITGQHLAYRPLLRAGQVGREVLGEPGRAETRRAVFSAGGIGPNDDNDALSSACFMK
jgi:hypothetical protein